jgi:hypothetical protein
MTYVTFSYLFTLGIFVSKSERTTNDWICFIASPITFPILLGMKFYTWYEKKN